MVVFEARVGGERPPSSYTGTILVRTQVEQELVGRPGLEPGTTGLKVRS